MRFVLWPGLLSMLALSCQATPPANEPAPPTASVPPAAGSAGTEPETPVGSPAAHEPKPGDGSEPTWKTIQPAASVPDGWRSCSESSECKLVETRCCDHCNGGVAVAVNAQHEPDVRAKYPIDKCTNRVCTERGCITRAACESGRCVMQWAQSMP